MASVLSRVARLEKRLIVEREPVSLIFVETLGGGEVVAASTLDYRLARLPGESLAAFEQRTSSEFRRRCVGPALFVSLEYAQ